MKTISTARNAVNSTLAGIALQLMEKKWDALMTSCLLGPLQVVRQPFLKFSPAVIKFHVMLQLSEGLVSLTEITLIKAAAPLQ